MNLCAVVLGVVLGCSAGPAPQERVDLWIAEDKARHFITSFAATAVGYGLARAGLDAEPAATVAVAGALALGVAKELKDVRSGGWFSYKDLVWDGAGVAVGAVLVHQIR